MKKNRLLKLADLLENLPRKKFDYTAFGTGVTYDLEACGTRACALGWATTIPCLKRAGLRLAWDENFNLADVVLKDTGLMNFGAASEVFDIDLDQAEFLFSPFSGSYNGEDPPAEHATPKQVAKHIRRFVEKYG